MNSAPKSIPQSLVLKEIQNPKPWLWQVMEDLSPGYGQFEPIAGFHIRVHRKLLVTRLKKLLVQGDTSILSVFAALYGSMVIPRYGHLKKISLEIAFKILYILYTSGDPDLDGLSAKAVEGK